MTDINELKRKIFGNRMERSGVIVVPYALVVELDRAQDALLAEAVEALRLVRQYGLQFSYQNAAEYKCHETAEKRIGETLAKLEGALK